MEAIILKCPENGRFHFGLTAPGPEIALSKTSGCFHSDTLFSALIVLCAKTFPDEVSAFIASFKSGEIKISSGSFCLEVSDKKEPIYFLPKPAHFDCYQDENINRKEIKDIQYISKKIWENGLTPAEWKKNRCVWVDKKFLAHFYEFPRNYGKEKIINSVTEPKIADHARKSVDNIFFQTDIQTKRTILISDTTITTVHIHLYFLLENERADERMKKLFDLLLDILIDEGFGGGISSGNGKIESIKRATWEWDNKIFSEQNRSHKIMASASLISPSANDQLDDILAGNVITRGGRNTSKDGTLKRIKMFKEGTIFNKDTISGNIPEIHNKEVQESNIYLRYGKAFPLPVHEKYFKLWQKAQTSEVLL